MEGLTDGRTEERNGRTDIKQFTLFSSMRRYKNSIILSIDRKTIMGKKQKQASSPSNTTKPHHQSAYQM